MGGGTLLVATEARYRRGPDGCARSTTGVDGYSLWQRYLDVFAHVLVLARTTAAAGPGTGEPVEGPGVRLMPLPDYRGAWEHVRVRHRLVRATRAAVQQADVLCLRAPGPIAGCAWRLRGARPFGVEVVGDPLDALARRAVRSAVRPFARRLLARELRAMCEGAVASAYVTERALQRRYPPGGWSLACSDIALADDAFAGPDAVRARARQRQGSTRHLVFVGSLARLYKGQDILLDAVARCRASGLDLTLTVVGDGAYRCWLETRADRHGLGGAVRFTGQLPPGTPVRDELTRADLFVLPSRTEGMPRAMLEAMAYGVPCLGTRVGGVPELLPDERLVPPGDVAALAGALGRWCAPDADLVAPALHDLTVAGRYRERALRPRRRAFLERLAAAARDGAETGLQPGVVGVGW